MPEQFILIPGRSSRQGVTLNEGKYTDAYIREINTLRMQPDDMRRLELTDGSDVRVWNEIGEIRVPCTDAGDECPRGLIFICYGDQSSRLMGGETHGSGMPDSKGLDVFVENPAIGQASAAERPGEPANTTPGSELPPHGSLKGPLEATGYTPIDLELEEKLNRSPAELDLSVRATNCLGDGSEPAISDGMRFAETEHELQPPARPRSGHDLASKPASGPQKLVVFLVVVVLLWFFLMLHG